MAYNYAIASCNIVFAICILYLFMLNGDALSSAEETSSGVPLMMTGATPPNAAVVPADVVATAALALLMVFQVCLLKL
jgi:hypothetical protein